MRQWAIPIGIHGVAETYSKATRPMRKKLIEIPWIIIWNDNILLRSRNSQEHLQNLERVFVEGVGRKQDETSEKQMSFPRRQGEIFWVLKKQTINSSSGREESGQLWSTNFDIF